MRLRFLDLARCLAIVMMTLAHVRDGLISPEGTAHALARLHDHTRGLTAPLFFLVAGWAFSAATLPRWRAFRSWGPPLRARLERIVVLFALGHLLTLPWWHEAFPIDVPRDVWLPFATSGVLECLALAMLASHLLLRVCPTPRALGVVSLLLAVCAAAAAAPIQEATSGWPLALKGPFNADGVPGGFPLAPFAAYFWLGTTLGVLRPDAWRLAAAGGAALALWWLLRDAFTGPRMDVGSPALFLGRTGWALLLLAGAAAADRLLPAGLSLERVASRGLTFYVGHMLVLWGVPFLPGLVHRLQHGLSAEGVVAVTVVLLAALCAVCLATERPAPETQRAAEG